MILYAIVNICQVFGRCFLVRVVIKIKVFIVVVIIDIVALVPEITPCLFVAGVIKIRRAFATLCAVRFRDFLPERFL